nr:uncharacterized protein LOC117840882 [Setaria viridis]
MGQLPIRVYFAGRIKFREALKTGLDYCRLRDRIPDSSTINLNEWLLYPFAIQPFKLWWAEWKQFLFCNSASAYCNLLDPSNIDPNAEAGNQAPPTHSRSGRLIESYPYTTYPLLGYDAPSVDMIAGRSKRVQKKVVKKTSRRVRARTGSADPPVPASAEVLTAPPPATQSADTQAITQAGAAAASLLLEALQGSSMETQSVTTRPDANTPLPSSIETIGTPSVPRQPIPSQGAGPSTVPIVVESSSSDEPMTQATEQDTTALQAQHEEIRFKMVSS